MMKISKGKKAKAQKVVVYGPAGIGKSTFASQFPKPLFIDVEDSTLNMDVERFDKPTSWQMLLSQVEFAKTAGYKTLIIDTADWSEELCKQAVMAKNNWKTIDASGYGVRYVALATEWGTLLNKLSEVVEVGINVVLTAHAQIKKFEQPDELGAYDRWELKLEKKTAALTKEWADLLLFFNYKTMVMTSQDGKSRKAQGQERTMYTTHNASWDAKNRHGLTDVLRMDFKEIEHIFKVERVTVSEKPKVEETFKDIIEDIDLDNMVNPFLEDDKPKNMSQGLWDLMKKDNITVKDIQKFTASQKITTEETPIENYPADYLKHIEANWNVVLEKIRNL